MTVKVDSYTRCMLTVIAVLLTVVAIGMWYETPSTVATTEAKIVDTGSQLTQIIDKMDQIDKSIGELKIFLASGKIKVQIVEADSLKKAPKTAVSTTTPVK